METGLNGKAVTMLIMKYILTGYKDSNINKFSSLKTTSQQDSIGNKPWS